jgi:predicted metal-dependent phosphoesterase TrpH
LTSAVDLHAHTTASDGTLTARELVAEAVRRGLRVLAVTDHDSTEAVGPALAAAPAHLTIVPGIEINCDVEGAEIHVLGYEMDYAAEWFQAFCRAQREERRARVLHMAERLAELGLPVDPAEVWTLVEEGSAGRPHVAQVMVRRGYVKSVREAFDRYLAAGRPAYVPRRKLQPADAVRLIRRAGGVPVLAHPGLARRDDLIPELLGAGLLGIECYYPEHSAAQRAHYLELCRAHDLVATGGSDFHGPRVRASVLGGTPVPLAAWEGLRARAAAARETRPPGPGGLPEGRPALGV